MGSAITNGCNCKCTQEQFKDENEIIKSNSNFKNLQKKNHKGKEIYTTIYRNKINSGKDEEDYDIYINKKQNEEVFYDLDEPAIETFNYEPYNINQQNNNCNISYKSNDNSNNNSKHNNNPNNNSKSTTNYNSIYNTNPNCFSNNNNNNQYNNPNYNNNDNNQIDENINIKNNNNNKENYNSINNKFDYFNSINNYNVNNFSNYENDDNYYNINDDENYNNANHINNNNYNHSIINHKNEDKINIVIDNEKYVPNPLNNNNKLIKKSTLKLFNISFNKSSIQITNKNSKRKIIPKHNHSKSQTNLNENSQLNHTIIINGIYKLNDIFINQINKYDNKINTIWKNIDITSIISKNKLNSINIDEIMFNGFMKRLIISNLFKNNSMNIQKFCILTKQDFIIFQNKENFLLMKNPQRKINLSEIENCGRLDFSLLKIHYLYGFYYMYINMKDEFSEEYNDDDDEVYKIVKKEQNGKFYILFSKEEKIVNQWVCFINFFMNMYKQ